MIWKQVAWMLVGFLGSLFWVLVYREVFGSDSAQVQTFRSCQTRAGVYQANDACRERCDLDRDGDVDQDDFGIFQRPPARPSTRPSSAEPDYSEICDCPCRVWKSPTGVPITCQLWTDLPQDLLDRMYAFQGQLMEEAKARGCVVPDVEFPQ